MKKIKSLIAIVGLSLLSACGGGGDGGGGGGGTPAPVASTSAFNLQAAYKSDNATSSSYRLSITGMQGTSPVSGNATAETGAVTSGTFEGQPALQQRTIIFGSITFNNQTVPISGSKISWMDTNYMPRGQSGKEYIVVDGTATLPTAAKVNDTGAVFTAKRYTTSDKTTLLGTETMTYLMEADTATTALVTLITVVKNNAGNTIGTGTNQYRITTANVFTRIKETAVDNTNGSSLTYTVIY